MAIAGLEVVIAVNPLSKPCVPNSEGKVLRYLTLLAAEVHHPVESAVTATADP